MRFLDNMPLARKILLCLSLLSVVAVGTGGFAVVEMQGISDRYDRVLDEEAAAGLMLTRANVGFIDSARVLTRMAAARNAQDARAEEPALLNARKTTDDRVAAALQAKPSLDQELGAFRASLARARDASGEVVRLAYAGEAEAATRVLRERYDPAQQEARGLLRASVERAEQRVAQAKVELHALAERTTWIVLAATIIGALGAISLAMWMVASGVTRPISRIVQRMRDLTAGDKAAPVPGAGRKDEVGTMAAALEVFRLAAIEQDRLSAAAQAETAGKAARAERVDGMVKAFEAEAAAVLRVVASAATELDATAGELQQTARGGTEASTSLAVASEQASANVATVASSAEEMAASIAEVARQITESARVARQASEDARNTDAAMAGLSDAAQRIGEVVQLISGIAGQTNLLALNATIEAARAGEHGKGFAVVASEVKQLAQQTAKATEEIGGQITAMQSETARAVEAIRAIGHTIESLDGLTAQVAAAAEQQAAATKEIGRAASEAASGTTEVNRYAGTVTEGAQRTGTAAAQVRAASGELAQRAEGLRAQVEQFLAGIRAA